MRPSTVVVILFFICTVDRSIQLIVVLYNNSNSSSSSFINGNDSMLQSADGVTDDVLYRAYCSLQGRTHEWMDAGTQQQVAHRDECRRRRRLLISNALSKDDIYSLSSSSSPLVVVVVVVVSGGGGAHTHTHKIRRNKRTQHTREGRREGERVHCC